MSRSPARAASVSSHTRKPFRVVGRHRAREHELRVGHPLAHDAERLDHADRVLPRIEAADLAHDRTVHVDAVLAGELLAERHRQLEVLHRERVDARRRVHARAPSRATAGTNSGIVHTDASCSSTNGRKNSHTVGVGVGEVDVAAPDPLGVAHPAAEALAQEAEHRCGLRIVDDDEVVVAVEQQRVVEHLLEVDALHRRGPLDVGALQAVVHGLGDREELVAAVHHLPVGVDADAAEQRDVRREQLGDAAAVRGRVEVEHPGPCSGAASSRIRSIDIDPDDARVVVEVLFEQRDAFEHGALRWCTSDWESRSIYRLMVCALVCPDKFSGTLERRGRGDGDGRRSRGARASTTWRSCRWPTAARARSTRCSRRVGGSRRHGDGHRSARAIRSRPSGRCCPAASRSSRWRAPAGSRSSPRATDPLRGVDARHRRADRGRASAPGRRRVIVGVGGSATTDGGLAALEALGWSFGTIPVTVACDVTTAVPRRGDGLRAAEGRERGAGRAAHPSPRAARRPVRAAHRGRRARARREPVRRVGSPAGSPRSAPSSNRASTWSPAPPGSETRSTTSTWS